MAARLVTRIAWAALGAFVAWAALGAFVAWQARALGLGSLDEPGPGMLAFGLGIAMTVVAVGDAAQVLLRRSGAGTAAGAQALIRVPWRQAGVLAVLLLYVALFESAGFALATFAFLLSLFATLSRVSWPGALALAAAASAGSYAIFRLGLGVQLPAGLLG